MRTCLQKFYPKRERAGRGLVATGPLGVDGQAPKTESNQPTHTDTERERKRQEKGRQTERNPVQLHFSLLPPSLSFLATFPCPLLAPLDSFAQNTPTTWQEEELFCFSAFPFVLFFSSFLFSTFSYWSIESACGWKERGVKVEERRWHWGSLRVLFLCRHEN